jgi:hypothetical protein
MWPSRTAEHTRIVTELQAARTSQGLKGIPDAATIDALAMQFIASLRREDYYRVVQAKQVSPQRADPNSPLFDAERAVAYQMQQGNIDEAGWLIFLMTHFARRTDTRWRRLQDVYGCLGAGIWDWVSVSANRAAFYQWLAANWSAIGGMFGNHRKYESLRPNAKRPMSRAVDNYLDWIGPAGHGAFFAKASGVANSPYSVFDHLYRQLKVNSFGRLAKFDYLSLIGRYGLANIEAGTAYLAGATGPSNGARLLVGGHRKSKISNQALQTELDALDVRLKVGMAVMEDALCNWQKSPRKFVHYIG